MNQTLDVKLYEFTDSWWNPRFIEPSIDKEFRFQFDASAIWAVRAGLVIIILFWCGFAWSDQFLSSPLRARILIFRFAMVMPLFLILGAISFTKITARISQQLITILISLTFVVIITNAALYGDIGLLANQLGFQLSMPSQDAKFIFVFIWFLVVFVGSLLFRIRTLTVLLLSVILLLAVMAAIYIFKPSAILSALTGPFVFASIISVFTGSLKMQRLSLSNYRAIKLLEKSSNDLEKSLDFLKTMFGRYISSEVMASLMENPFALELGGKKRKVSIMMTDLRGFTAVAERLEPEQVVLMLNSYFEIMVEVVLQFKGTINNIIGDALLITFGAPQDMPDRAQRAIACAITMQNAMADVNEQNRVQGLPDLEMGVGINETEVIVGNIGSSIRSQYTVVGSGVNMTSRIESYSVGGQVLVSESVVQEAGDILRIDSEREVFPKGALAPLKIYEVGGIAGQYNLALAGKDLPLVTLTRQIPLNCQVLEGKTDAKRELDGFVIKLSKKCAEIILDGPVNALTNLKMNLVDVDVNLAIKHFYGKIIEYPTENDKIHMVRFTSVPPEIDAYFQSHRQHSTILHSE